MPLPDTAPPGPRDRSERVWTVSQVNRLVKDLIEQSLYPLWVRGEISNLVIHRSGHVYFTVKDESSQLNAVHFRGAGAARQAGLKNGDQVDLWGRLTVYEPRGQYQLIVERMRLGGTGLLQQRFEELKRRLQAEGLFDQERKRPVPPLPSRIGLITSPQGAAIRDFLQILGRRFSGLHVRIFPARVQGRGAATELVRALERLNALRACDVIVLTRGGGSLEDLWPFNEEILARAIAASDIPVISAVGHEVDFTIADFVADLRVPTPSAAAELVTARKAELYERIIGLQRRLRSALTYLLSERKRRLTAVAGSYVFREPRHLVRTYQQRLDEFQQRAEFAVTRALTRDHNRVNQAVSKLEALDPTAVLERGYAILSDSERHVVTGWESTSAGARLRARLARGALDVEVVECLEGRSENAL